ncbi:hypothetical protein [Oryzomicrobium sp.]|uniref:hypothetical protein n=1 Tax=Oryzomicrobium sp. TaxID=1911578 RepID=UPI002FE0E23C
MKLTRPIFLRLAWALFVVVAALVAHHFGLVGHGAGGEMLVGIGLSTTAFPVSPSLSAVAIGYRNPDIVLIADEALPRVPTAKKFSYTKYGAAQGFTVPDTKVGRRSEPNMVDFGGTLINDEVEDHGLDDLVPNDDIKAWEDMAKPASGGPIDPRALSTMMLTSLVQLDREVRVANTVFNAANYVAANQQTLGGTSQWSDYANSNPLYALLTALDSTLVRPNQMNIGQAAWTTLRQHPKIVQAVFKTQQGAGVVTRQALAELLELEKINVGQAWVNTARKGQAPNYQRAWGKHCSLTFTSLQAAQLGQPCYGFTAQWGTRIAGALPEPKVGLRGGERVRSGESVKEVISAPDAGYFFQNVIG